MKYSNVKVGNQIKLFQQNFCGFHKRFLWQKALKISLELSLFKFYEEWKRGVLIFLHEVAAA